MRCDKCGMQFKGEIVYPIWCKCGAIYDAPDKSRGLGDTVAKVLSSVGIKKSKNCKCSQRQDKLNKLVPYKSGQ